MTTSCASSKACRRVTVSISIQHLLSCKKFFASFFTTASQLKLQQARNDDVESGEESTHLCSSTYNFSV